MKPVDYPVLKNGFEVSQNRFSKFWFCLSKDCNEDGEYQFCFKDLKYFLNNIFYFYMISVIFGGFLYLIKDRKSVV